ncbi:hypothetical protein [Paenibacillus tarimensis]|uniref:hypothetical protein n=1 Tax=Paenibacillus tarimensis TaxID=416012 RepID=UPI001F29072D|nr:hypothetical protein [Paenibacillus tarimensis]MCF2946455.1 hypothetical protein [Paenibacillus tarimensis]
MNRSSHLTSGLIGTVVGAVIGIAGTLLVLYITLSFNFAVDSEAAKIELENAVQLINTYKSDPIGPRYKLLNTEIEWKTVLLNVNSKEFSEMYYELIRMDLLRDMIINASSENEKNKLIDEYNSAINLIKKQINFDEQLGRLEQINKNRIE